MAPAHRSFGQSVGVVCTLTLAALFLCFPLLCGYVLALLLAELALFLFGLTIAALAVDLPLTTVLRTPVNIPE